MKDAIQEEQNPSETYLNSELRQVENLVNLDFQMTLNQNERDADEEDGRGDKIANDTQQLIKEFYEVKDREMRKSCLMNRDESMKSIARLPNLTLNGK